MTNFRESVRESLDNALENGDDEFLVSLEKRDAEAIFDDMCDCDADVDRAMERAAERGVAESYRAMTIGIIKEWCEENPQ